MMTISTLCVFLAFTMWVAGLGLYIGNDGYDYNVFDTPVHFFNLVAILTLCAVSVVTA